MAIIVSLPDPEEWDDLRYAAEMTDRQFHALRAKIKHAGLIPEVAALSRVTRPRLSKTGNVDEISKSLLNGWNTEHQLNLTTDILKQDGGSGALQWSFPQAYYSTYAVALAYFNAAGFTERTHAGVLKKFGELVALGEYPARMSFYATGTPQHIKLHNISRVVDGSSPLSFDASDPASIDKHICQLLSGTRKWALDEKKKAPGARFRTKSGKPKKKLSQSEWQSVGASLGATTLLTMLYRKRIKSNYREVDTFALASIDAERVHSNLLWVVRCMNFTHECFIAAALGWDRYDSIASGFLKRCRLDLMERRLPHVRAVVQTAERAKRAAS